MPTFLSIAIASFMEAASFRPLCSRSGSPTCHPVR
jgi:hypothetical protein